MTGLQRGGSIINRKSDLKGGVLTLFFAFIEG